MLLRQRMSLRELAQLHVFVVSRTNFQETQTSHELLDEMRYHSMMIRHLQISIQELPACIQVFTKTKI